MKRVLNHGTDMCKMSKFTTLIFDNRAGLHISADQNRKEKRDNMTIQCYAGLTTKKNQQEKLQ